jgi:hypothetical protein
MVVNSPNTFKKKMKLLGLHPDFINDWKAVCTRNEGQDPCSSGPLKHVAKWILKLFKQARDYCILCLAHDFDYQFGPKYGISKWKADWYLGWGTAWACKKPFIGFAIWAGLTIGGWKAWNEYRRK